MREITKITSLGGYLLVDPLCLDAIDLVTAYELRC